MTILVAGAAGFIGSNLVTELQRSNLDVIAFDSQICSGGYADFQVINGDITDSKFVEAFRNEKITFIINLACPASPPTYQKYPFETMAACTSGVQNLCDLARETGATLIHTSTSEVYGDPEISPQPEIYRGSVNTLGPRACYDEAKRFSETLIYENVRRYGLNVVILRLFNTYGPRMSLDDGRVISNLVKAHLKKEEFTIYGDGLQTRSFCYIQDSLNAFLKLIEIKPTGLNVYNLGNPSEITLLELVAIFKKNISPITVKFTESPIDDPRQRKPDISKIKSAIDWEPKVSITHGLLDMVSFYESL